MSEPRITIDYEGDCTCPNDHSSGELDEFVAEGVDVHFEAMDTAQWWIGITDPNTGRSWHICCGAVNPRARGYALIEEDTPVGAVSGCGGTKGGGDDER